MRRVAYILMAICMLAFVAGCKSPTSRTLMPPIPDSGDVAAKSRFSELKRQFEQDGHVTPDEFTVVAQEFPEDPVAPFALLYAAKSARKAGDVVAAQAALDTLRKEYPSADPAIARRLRLELGLTMATAGSLGAAFAYLEDSEPAVESDAERALWLYLTYRAASEQGLVVAWPWHARASRELVGSHDGALGGEAAYNPDDTKHLVDAASLEDLVKAWKSRQGGAWPGISLVGRKLLATTPWPLKEDGAAVRKIVLENDRALGVDVAAMGLPLGLREIGALIPQSGKSVRLGEALERMLSIKGQAPDRVWLGDSTLGSKVVASLAGKGIKGVVGPVDAEAHAALVPGLEAQNITSLSLSLVPEESAARPHQFFIVHSATARAKALARYAKKNGVATVTVLAADSGYGKAVSAAFAAEAKALGMKTTSYSYDAKATNFGAVVGKVAKGTAGIFIADAAPRIELIAPALAAAGHKALAAGKKGGFVLMSTAEGMGPELMASAGRYLLGAVFAPGFTAAAEDEAALELLTKYREATGKSPSAIEAYAFDAVTLLQTVGANVDALALSQQVGLTGTIRFGTDRRRADDGVFYTVVDNAETGLRSLVRLAN